MAAFHTLSQSPFTPMILFSVNYENKTKPGLPNICRVRVLDQLHDVILLASLHYSLCLAPQLIFEQIYVS